MIRGESTRGHDSSEANLDDDDDIDGFGESDPQGYVPLDLAEVYSVVSKSYLISGKVRSTHREVKVLNFFYSTATKFSRCFKGWL